MSTMSIRRQITEKYNASGWFRLFSILIFAAANVLIMLRVMALDVPEWAMIGGAVLLTLSLSFFWTWLVTWYPDWTAEP